MGPRDAAVADLADLEALEGDLRRLPPSYEPWARALALALGARGRVAIDVRDAPVEVPEALVVQLDGGPLGQATFRLGKACAAALVLVLLRRGEGLERTSHASEVPRAIGALLARSVTHPLAPGATVRVVEPATQPRVAPGVLLCFRDVHDAPLEAALEVRAAERSERTTTIALLEDLELELPLLVAISHAPWQELRDMAPGDLWMPDSGWLISPDDQNGASRAALLGLPNARRLAVVRLVPGGLAWDGAIMHIEDEGASPEEPPWAEVRVSAGSVRCSLRSWLDLVPPVVFPYQRPDRYSLWIDGKLRARGTARTLQGAWGIELDEVCREPEPTGAAP